jgi:peptide/nickel transport system substrate-binding protein
MASSRHRRADAPRPAPRRSPLKKPALLALALFVLAACSSPVAHSSGSRNPWTRPGILRMAGRQVPDNLNTLLGGQTIDTDLSMFWAAYLFRWSDHNELVPELAARIPTLENGDIAPNGKTITYHLRKGVRWHDGAPFDANDVIYTWRTILNPRNFVVSHAGYDVIDDMQARDPYTLVVRLKRPFAPFVANFFALGPHPDCILPRHILSKFPDINHIAYNQKPVGTGPFKVEKYQPGQKIVFVANPDYWRGPPKLARVEYSIVQDDNAILNLVRTHAIDFYFRVAETMGPSAEHVPGTRVVLANFFRFADLGFNAGVPALSDLRVREALAYDTDRRALIDKVTHGIARDGDTDQPPWSWAYSRPARTYPYDPARAAKLFDAAGWRMGADGIRRKRGEPLHLTLTGFSGSNTASSAQVQIQSQWRKSGVDVTIKNYTSAQLYATLGMGGVEQSGRFDVIFENWAGGTDPDDAILLACDMRPPNGWNVYRFCNKDVDAAEKVALSSYDAGRRKAAYAVIQRIESEQLPFFVLWYQREFDVVNTDLKGYRPAGASTPFWNTWDWSI